MAILGALHECDQPRAKCPPRAGAAGADGETTGQVRRAVASEFDAEGLQVSRLAVDRVH